MLFSGANQACPDRLVPRPVGGGDAPLFPLVRFAPDDAQQGLRNNQVSGSRILSRATSADATPARWRSDSASSSSSGSEASPLGRRTKGGAPVSSVRGGGGLVEAARRKKVWLLRHDFFHFLLDDREVSTRGLLLLIVGSYLLVWFFFACVLAWAVPHEECDLRGIWSGQPEVASSGGVATSSWGGGSGGAGVTPAVSKKGKTLSFVGALYFSVETMTTIGYGTQDQFFNHCSSMFFVLFLQMICATILTPVAVGLLYARLSRAQNRSATVLFSRHATVEEVGGQLFLCFRVGDLRKDALVNSQITCYVYRHGPPGSSCRSSSSSGACREGRRTTTQGVRVENGITRRARRSVLQQSDYFQQFKLELQRTPLFPDIPDLVVHRIDESSPLVADWCRRKVAKQRRRRQKLEKEEEAERQAFARRRRSGDKAASGETEEALCPPPFGNALSSLPGCRWTTLGRQELASLRALTTLACPACGETFRRLPTLLRHCELLAHKERAIIALGNNKEQRTGSDPDPVATTPLCGESGSARRPGKDGEGAVGRPCGGFEQSPGRSALEKADTTQSSQKVFEHEKGLEHSGKGAPHSGEGALPPPGSVGVTVPSALWRALVNSDTFDPSVSHQLAAQYLPKVAGALALPDHAIPGSFSTRRLKERLRRMAEEEYVEIVVIVTGTEAITSQTTQAFYSYTAARDWKFDHSFPICVYGVRDFFCVEYREFHSRAI